MNLPIISEYPVLRHPSQHKNQAALVFNGTKIFCLILRKIYNYFLIYSNRHTKYSCAAVWKILSAS